MYLLFQYYWYWFRLVPTCTGSKRWKISKFWALGQWVCHQKFHPLSPRWGSIRLKIIFHHQVAQNWSFRGRGFWRASIPSVPSEVPPQLRDEKVRSRFLIQERSLGSFEKVYFWHDIYFAIKSKCMRKPRLFYLIKTNWNIKYSKWESSFYFY